MKRHLIASAMIAITIALTGSAMAQQLSPSVKWTRTYVVEWNEPAMYYGAKTGVIDPDRLRLHAPVSFDEVEISGTTARRKVNVELRSYDGERLARRTIAAQTVPEGRAVHLTPNNWTKLAHGKVDARDVLVVKPRP